MTDYTPSGNPSDNTRGLSKKIRDEFALIDAAIRSKSNKLSYTSVSSTSLTIATGAQTLTIETGKEFSTGMNVVISDAALPAANFMSGKVTSYDNATGLLVCQIATIFGSGTKTAWVVSLGNDNGVTLIGNTFTGAQNFARATVASSATTSDIWNALGNQIDFTGTATVTGFPNAPQGGSVRELVCAAACSFTAGANMLIDGLSSGETVTCATNDVVVVRAINTTQFRLTRIRYDGISTKSTTDNVVTVYVGNGVGSTNNLIRRYTTVLSNIGSAITYADSATLGASFTINENGLYEIYMQEVITNASAVVFGASINSSQLTTSIGSITLANRACIAVYAGSGTTPTTVSRSIKCVSGDVIRPHIGSSLSLDSTRDVVLFSVRKIANV